MTNLTPPMAPPFCPNPACRFHRGDKGLWRYKRAGFYRRTIAPLRVQRYRCVTCRRYFADQTFRVTYWLHRPELLRPVFHRLVGCSGLRQIAREFGVSPQTILTHAARLGRHCLLFHERVRPKGPIAEPLALDSFQSFEFSQYFVTQYHVVAGQESHFFHGFTESECRRSGAMTPVQRRKRERLERKLGRPDPRAIEKDVAALLSIVAPGPQELELHTDEHKGYPRAVRRVRHLAVRHRTISSRAARTTRNPLFAINLIDLLIRHSSANHKRETPAYSKRRQGAIERLWVFLVWRNYVKWFSEFRPGETPAMRIGLTDRRLSFDEITARRLFPTRGRVPERWQDYYYRRIPTRMIPNGTVHAKRYAA